MSEAQVSKILSKRKPKTAKGKRILRKREPQAVEPPKTAIVVAGSKCPQDVANLLRDLSSVRQPLATLYMRKHPYHPFEDITPLEKLCMKHDHGLFAFGSSSKKRPFRLVLGRLFDSHVLDMQEYTVSDYKSIQSFAQNGSKDSQQGNKPLLVFQGTPFEGDDRMKRAKSLLMDFFSGPRPEKVMLEGVDNVVVFSALEPPPGSSEAPVIMCRRYRISMLKSGSKMPRTELSEVGPRFSLKVDRAKDPDRERWKMAIKVPKEVKPKKQKNVKKNTETGERRGQVHLGRQLYDTIHTVHHGESKRKKMKAEIDQAKAKAREAAEEE